MHTSFLSSVLALALWAGIAPVAASGDPHGPAVPLSPTATTDRPDPPLPTEPRGELVVTYRPGATPASRRAARASVGAGSPAARAGRLEVVRVHPSDAAAAAAELRADPAVLTVEPNRIFTATGVPNDQNYGEQWGLDNVAQFGFGTPGADISAPDAWSTATGSAAVVVAVVDSGMALSHPDLSGRVWSNGGETINGVDDDGNGYVDDVRGWDWVGDDPTPNDPNGHGTHVAGIIGAQADNGVGVSGVAWDVRLMPLRVLNAGGGGYLSDIAAAFRYAGENGADVVNASLGAFGPEPKALRAAIKDHPKTLFVFAAGNGTGDGDSSGDDNDVLPMWPCNHTLANVICVTASDEYDGRAHWANVGRRSVDLAAPGVDVLSTSPAADGSASGAASLTDSPDGFYANGSDSWVRRDAALDLSSSEGCSATFDVMLETEYKPPAGADDDWLRFEGSSGGSWTRLLSLTGSTGGDFRSYTASLTAFDHTANVQLRFRMDTDAAIVYDGAHIDNLSVSCDVGDPGFVTETFEAGLAGWTAGGSGATWGTSGVADEYEYMSGTSMAAPFVAGAAAVLWAERPAGVTKKVWSEHVRNVLHAGVDRARTWMVNRTAWGGRLDLAASLAVTGDLTPPTKATMKPVGGRFTLGRRIRIAPHATDAQTGIGSYEHRVRTASHRLSFSAPRLWRAGPRVVSFTGKLGRTYCFTSRALDGARNPGLGSERDCTALPFNDRSLRRRGTWKEIRPDGAYRGTALRTTRRGARLVMRGVATRQLSLVVTACPRCGKLAVFRNGKRLKVLDLGRRGGRSTVLNVARFGRVTGKATITIKVLSRGKPVLIEGLGVSRA